MLAAVAQVFGEHHVSIRSMEQIGLGDEARLVFITHTALEADVQATLASLAELDVVERIGGVLRVIGPERLIGRPMSVWRGVIEEYRDFLPVSEATPVVTLLEGGTPLLAGPAALGARRAREVLLKLEGANPTGSFKDRGMTMAISKAAEEGAEAVVCASTGNTSASAAAYAARAGMSCVVLIPEGHIALGKLAQALVHGARVLQVRGNFDVALEIVRELPAPCPGRGRELGQPVPHRGAEDGRLRDRGRPRRRPGCPLHPGRQRRQHHRLLARVLRVPQRRAVDEAPAECSGSRPPVRRRSSPATRSPSPRRSPRRSASATRLPGTGRRRRPRSRAAASIAVTDDEILEAYRFLAAEESVFCEAASAASVAGLLKTPVAEGLDGRVRADRPRAEGPGSRDQPGVGARRSSTPTSARCSARSGF